MAPLSLTPDSRLAHYEILEPIGAGSMGEVYLARDTQLGRDVALKVLPSAFAKDAERVEHSLFSHISRIWEGEPLESFEKILKFIRTTTTNVGLKVRAVLNTKTYPKGVKISDEKMESLSIRKGRALPKWNYTIRPRRMSN